METAKNEEGLNEVLVEELMGGIQVESLVQEKSPKADPTKPVKTYKTIAGLNNIGKTFFCSGDEIEKTRQWVEAQMAQKYGAEIYGISAQQKGQSANRGSQEGDGTGTGQGQITSGSLIQCQVNPLMDLQQLNESFGDPWKNFFEALNNLSQQFGKNKEGKPNQDFASKFNKADGAEGKNNKKAWTDLQTFLQKDDQKYKYNNNDNFKKCVDKVIETWKAWGGKIDNTGEDKGGKGKEFLGGNSSVSGETWNRFQAWRIDIHTDFNEQWFQRKFKSGLLNKAIMAIKTGVSKQDAKSSSMKDHKYTANEMLPQDVRKLDSIQWKMTNKVAKDFVSLLLGWSRKKEYAKDQTGIPKPLQPELTQDKGFGSTMAKKALDGRGILGRLKQKIFSGGQNNNVISIAFQMADWLDGWADKTEEENEKKKKEDKEKEKELGKTTSSGEEGDSGSEQSKPTEPSDGGSEEPTETSTQPTSESTEVDPFADVFMEGWDSDIDPTRRELVVEACEEKEGSVDKLIDDCLIG